MISNMGTISDISIEEIIKVLGLEKQKNFLGKHWKDSCTSYKENIFFLNDEHIVTSNDYFSFPNELLIIFSSTISLINSNKYLRILAWHLHQILFNYNDTVNIQELIADWPNLETSMGELSDMFAAVVFTSGLKFTLCYYNDKGIPDKVAKDTLDDFLRWLNVHHKNYGRWGFSEYEWLNEHFSGRLFRFERLQFQPSKFSHKIIVYKNISNKQIMVFSEEAITYRRDGQIDGTNGIFDTEGKWVSRIVRKDGKIFGNPVLENASCSKETIELCDAEWELVLKKDDLIMNIHIPEGGKLDHEQCINSYSQASSFCKKYFPEQDFKAFACCTWFLDIQLRSILDCNSNIVRFMNDFYLFPVYTPKKSHMYERVFGRYIDNAAEMPENTNLQKAIKQYIAAGNHMRNGAGFILINQ